ncbi:MAG TPA: chitobiase/beta-hexosaminidase C-terminal domain-containing protein [Terracidiphilus sp.]|nr:chitobiase/beta-hexosaminidase C-terminal domain-containing protein [Terracidiphilus sp.]
MMVFVLFALHCGAQNPTANEWTWQAGVVTLPQPAVSPPTVWGTQGVFAPGNNPGPASDDEAWTSKDGKLWLYGNGLWEFDPTLEEWAWISGAGPFADEGHDPYSILGIYGTLGVTAAGNHPGVRYGSSTWTDSSGRLWLFGGFGYGSDGALDMIELNDLWMFDPSNQEWTWMGGSETGATVPQYGTQGVSAPVNVPGPRSDAATWLDSNGRVWLYGGTGEDANLQVGYLTDLWVFDPSISQWTWVAGTDTNSGNNLESAVYGTLGVASAGNNPGTRVSSSTWADKNGNLWLFGGVAEPNDLWEFNPTVGEWTWMGGSNAVTEGVSCSGSTTTPCAERGIYGTLGVPAAGNVPGERAHAYAWTDQNGEFWLYGGQGEDSVGNPGMLDDLWRFDPDANEWAWMGGTSTMPCADTNYGFTCTTLPVPGTMGTAAVVNTPGGRYGGSQWLDGNGNLWLMGWVTSIPGGGHQLLNDMWEFSPSLSSLPPAITPIFSPVSGNYQSTQTVTLFNGMSNADIYYTTDGTTPTSNSALYTGPITVPGTETLEAIAIASGYPESGLATASYDFKSDTPTFSQPAGTYFSAIQVTISDTTAGAAIFYTTDGSTPRSNSTQVNGNPIQVSKSETIKAIAIANGYSSDVASASYVLNVGSPTFILSAQPDALAVNSGSAGSVSLMVTPQNGFNAKVSFACSGLPAGATCSFNPATVTPVTGAATTTLTITSAEQSAALQPGSQEGWPAALAMCMLLFGWKRRGGATRWLLVLAACVCLSMVSACGGGATGGGGGGTTSVTSTVTVTATSGSIQQTAKISFTVN